MSLLTGLPSAISCFFIGTNIPIKIDRCKSFMIYFQIFTTFRYKSLKNSEMLVAFLGGDGGKSDKNVECAKEENNLSKAHLLCL